MSYTEEELEQDFMTNVTVDMGYYRATGGWSLEEVNTEKNRIVFEKS